MVRIFIAARNEVENRRLRKLADALGGQLKGHSCPDFLLLVDGGDTVLLPMRYVLSARWVSATTDAERLGLVDEVCSEWADFYGEGVPPDPAEGAPGEVIH